MPAFANGVSRISLSAGQAAGTAPIVGANPNRTCLIIGNIQATDARFGVTDVSDGYGMPLPAKSSVILGGGQPGWPNCPTDAIYVGGLSAADKVTVWEV